MSKIGKPLKIKENPTIIEQREELRQLQTGLNIVPLYLDFKILCARQDRRITTALKEAIYTFIKLKKVTHSRMSVFGAIKQYANDKGVTAPEVMEDVIRRHLKKYKVKLD